MIRSVKSAWAEGPSALGLPFPPWPGRGGLRGAGPGGAHLEGLRGAACRSALGKRKPLCDLPSALWGLFRDEIFHFRCYASGFYWEVLIYFQGSSSLASTDGMLIFLTRLFFLFFFHIHLAKHSERNLSVTAV